jgi:bacterioferritin-associated ferredoxin
MYACVCNGHRESELRDIARQGVGCVREAYDPLGAPPGCGRCLEFAQQVIDESCGPGAGTFSAEITK